MPRRFLLLFVCLFVLMSLEKPAFSGDPISSLSEGLIGLGEWGGSGFSTCFEAGHGKEVQCEEVCGQIPGKYVTSYCASRSLSKKACTYYTVGLYAAVATAASCAYSCFSPGGQLPGGMSPADYACIVAGLASDANSIASVIELNQEGNQWLSELFSVDNALLLGGTTFDVGMSAFTLYKKGHTGTIGTAWSCTSMGMSIVSLGLTLKGMEDSGKRILEDCSSIKSLRSSSSYLFLPSSFSKYFADLSAIFIPHSYAKSTSAELGAPSPILALNHLLLSDEPLPGSIGPVSKVLNQMPDRFQIPGMLNKLDYSLEQEVVTLKTSHSLKTWASRLPVFPHSLLSGLEKFDQRVQRGQIKALSSPSDFTQTQTGFVKRNSLGDWVTPRSRDLEQVTQGAVAPRATGDEVSGSDIWHSDTYQNIFQIVSSAIVKNMSKVVTSTKKF